jgi:ketosteroid isomerase-like protein
MPFATRSLLPTVAFCAILGCAPAPAAPTFTDADRVANLALSQHFRDKVIARDWDGATALYTAGAVLLPPSSPAIHGRAGIRAFLGGFPPLTELTIVDDTIVGAGDRAYAIGRYHMTIAMKGAPVDSGKFVDIRERQADGSWIYTVDMFSSSIPAPAAP